MGFRRKRSPSRGSLAPLDEEENWDEQLQLVYGRLPRLESNDNKTAKSLIKRYGVKSDPPDVLAVMVLMLAEAFFGGQAPTAVSSLRIGEQGGFGESRLPSA